MAASGSRFSSQSLACCQASSLSCFFLLLLTTAAPSATGQSLPGCPSKCGEVDVPYPFGLSQGCARHQTFVLNCSSSSGGTGAPARLYTPDGFQVFKISIVDGFLDVSLFFVRDCYKSQGGSYPNSVTNSPLKVSVAPPFTISPDRNRFVITGCDAYFYYWDNFEQNGFWTGCLAGCGSLAAIVNNTCNGFGCCESNMRKGLRTLEIKLQSYNNHSRVFNFNPCSYAFIVNRDQFAFDTTWITTDYSSIAPPRLLAVLDWSIEGANCSADACASSNSECVAAPNGLGYLCNCSAGYTGNPYLREGCQDIDECKVGRQIYPCYGHCTNTQGSYICSCPAGTYSDDPKKFKCTTGGLSLAYKLLIGIGSGMFFCFLVGTIIYVIIQKRKLVQLREKFFQQNGGIFLQQSIMSHQHSSFKIFKMFDIEKATKKFDEDLILGRGGFGTVYKGVLDDGRVIAVKKSIMIDEKQNQEFAKEIFILSQINHKNIVKLLGCCLESEVPMLVYEYISNGTLFDYIHKKERNVHIPLTARMKFAVDSAEALRYLHTDASPPILHGDVKSSNVLLDENLVAKVSDFGTSIFAPKDRAQFTTFVQGTCGYLDPEYMQTSQLTDKSDVYSFGMILLEILTGKTPLFFEAQGKERNLASAFISRMNENKLIDILDPDIVQEGSSEQVIGVAELAVRCLRLTGKQRPSMKEVVTVLDRLYELNGHAHEVPSTAAAQSSYDQCSFNTESAEYISKEAERLLVLDGR